MQSIGGGEFFTQVFGEDLGKPGLGDPPKKAARARPVDQRRVDSDRAERADATGRLVRDDEIEPFFA